MHPAPRKHRHAWAHGHQEKHALRGPSHSQPHSYSQHTHTSKHTQTPTLARTRKDRKESESHTHSTHRHSHRSSTHPTRCSPLHTHRSADRPNAGRAESESQVGVPPKAQGSGSRPPSYGTRASASARCVFSDGNTRESLPRKDENLSGSAASSTQAKARLFFSLHLTIGLVVPVTDRIYT